MAGASVGQNAGSRCSGQVMQCEPPRPRPSSKPSMGSHLDAGLAQRGVGAGVALVADDDAGLERDDVVAVVPLLALGLEGVTAGLDDAHLRVCRAPWPSARAACRSAPPRPGRPARRPGGSPRCGAADHLREEGDQVPVAHGDDRVQVHVAARLGQVHGEHEPADPARNSDRAIHSTAWGVVRSPMPIITAPLPIGCTSPPSTWQRPQFSSGAAEPDAELLRGEHRVEAVDRLHDHRLRLAGRLGHRVERDAVVDPAGRVALEQEVRQRRQQHARRGRPIPRRGPRPAARRPG